MRRLCIPALIVLMLILTTCSNNGVPAGQPRRNLPGVEIEQGLSAGKSNLLCPASSNMVAQPLIPQKPITLNVTGWSSSPAENIVLENNFKDFERLYPTIKLNWSPISSEYSDRMRSLTDTNRFDVFFMRPDMAPEYIYNGKLLNLSPYMVRDHIANEDYHSSLLAPFICKDLRVFGIPKDWGTLGVFYNKELFRNAGVPYPKDDWTWADMQAIAKKLTRTSNGQTTYGVTLSDYSSRWLAFLFANGGSVLNKDGTRATFNSDAGVEALDFYTSFQRAGTSVLASKLEPNLGTAPLDAFGHQKVAMVLEGGWLIPYLKSFASFDYGIAPLPVSPIGKRANLIFTNAWSASSQTKYPAAAWEFIKYMTGKQAQANVLHSGFALPSLKSLTNDSYFKSHPGVKVLFDAAHYGYVDYYGPQDFFIHRRLDLAANSVLNGRADSRSVLNSTAQQINELLGPP